MTDRHLRERGAASPGEEMRERRDLRPMPLARVESATSATIEYWSDAWSGSGAL
jgi:hypothetical protein